MTFWQNLGTITGAVITVATIIGFLVRWILKQNEKHDKKLLEPILSKLDCLHESGMCRAKENGIMFRALLGIIDCLETQKINGNLSTAKTEINKYLTNGLKEEKKDESK